MVFLSPDFVDKWEILAGRMLFFYLFANVRIFIQISRGIIDIFPILGYFGT